MFQDALQQGETSFRTLPTHAKLVALNRTTMIAADQAVASAVLDDVGTSYVELSTPRLAEAVGRYLAIRADTEGAQTACGITLLDILASQIPTTNHPVVSRPPCVLRPSEGVFLDGWMRFFSYYARGDSTIPLLAIDWPAFFERLCSLDPGYNESTSSDAHLDPRQQT
ncbi:hypothetical protein [Paraburkholderia sp. GAS41]|uniref:hypothetical protein n=1 Tax=Paraburkholderia sp. GAS41 TaxID=3035134 RepID=UPI003D1F0FB5